MVSIINSIKYNFDDITSKDCWESIGMATYVYGLLYDLTYAK